MSITQDIDIFGRESFSGTALELLQEEAIHNAIILMLTAKKGEFIYNSHEGGIIDELLFKPMTTTSIERAKFKIRNAIVNHFTPSISIQNIDIVPNYEQRYYTIEIIYEGIFTREEEKVSFFTKGSFKNVYLKYIDIEYIEENLKNFCMLKKSSIPDAKLLLNSDEGLWVWDKYRLINLTDSDSHFAEILAICNLSAT